jgi:hypothetical protein
MPKKLTKLQLQKQAERKARMPNALNMVRLGLTAYIAAQRTGLSSGAIYKNAEYRAIMADRAKEKTDAK